MEVSKSKVNDIQKKSDFVYEVLQKSPSWIITWGNSFFLLFLLLIVILAHLIQYPDTIVAKTTIRMKNPPISVIAENSEVIEKIYFHNGDSIDSGAVIVKLKSRALWNDVKKLENDIVKFKEIEKDSNQVDFEFSSNYRLGELSLVYNAFLKEYDDFKYFVSNDIVLKKINSLRSEISNIILLNKSLIKQEDILQKKFELSQNLLNRNRKLNNKGVISDQQFENMEADYLTESKELENFKTNQLNNKVRIIQLNSVVNNLLNEKEKELVNWNNRLAESLNKISFEIDVWNKKYLLKAPISGALSFDKSIVKNFFVTNGEVVFDVIPASKQQLIGIAEMPLTNSGEIKVGSNVQIRFDGFPYQEYGVLNSVVKDIALIPKTTGSQPVNILELELPYNLKTNYGKNIIFTHNMTATSLIIKEKKSVLERLFYQLHRIFAK